MVFTLLFSECLYAAHQGIISKDKLENMAMTVVSELRSKISDSQLGKFIFWRVFFTFHFPGVAGFLQGAMVCVILVDSNSC